MKKNILSVVLCVLLVMPFAVCAVADSNAPFENIGTITDYDYYHNIIIDMVVKKPPEITPIPESDCFEAYGIIFSAMVIPTDDVIGYMKELAQKEDMIYVRMKTEGESITHEAELLLSQQSDIVAFDIAVSYPDWWRIGDVNGDARIDAMDYVLAKRYCLGTYFLRDIDIMRADVNDDGVLDAQDYAIIKRAVLGTYELEKIDYITE